VRDAVSAAVVRGERVELDVGGPLPPVIGDVARLRQAVDNLIVNAVTHGGRGPVTVRAHATGGTIRISVIDSGSGIPAAEQRRIFELGVSLDPESGGTGIGLPLTKAIAEAHGGALELESTPGIGSTFTLVLPASPS
jgi:signal transduction histidine kinase